MKTFRWGRSCVVLLPFSRRLITVCRSFKPSQLEENVVTVQFSPGPLLPAVCPGPLTQRKGPSSAAELHYEFISTPHILGKGEIRERASMENKPICLV